MLRIKTIAGRNKNSPCQVCIVKIICKENCKEFLRFCYSLGFIRKESIEEFLKYNK
jgi:hypothetical protein